MIESSNTQEPVETTEVADATPTETSQTENSAAPAAEAQPDDIRTAMEKAAKGKPTDVDGVTPKAASPGAPGAVVSTAADGSYQPNYKYKAFGKERELPEAFRSIIKDPETEKTVKDVFTRADAFDDMKTNKENISREFQELLGNHTSLDRDVKRVMNFRNNGDFDNFFAALKISDQDVFSWVENKLNAMKDPAQMNQYQQAVQARAQSIMQQEQYTDLRQNYDRQAVQARTYALDMVLNRPDVSSVASAWDTRAGEIGAFRTLVTQEAANVYFHSQGKQDLSAEQAVDLVMKKFGKFVETVPQSQSFTQATSGSPQAPQAPAQAAPQAKPVIPNVSGKGASPVKQIPKSLDDLRKLGKAARQVQEIPNF